MALTPLLLSGLRGSGTGVLTGSAGLSHGVHGEPTDDVTQGRSPDLESMTTGAFHVGRRADIQGRGQPCECLVLAADEAVASADIEAQTNPAGRRDVAEQPCR